VSFRSWAYDSAHNTSLCCLPYRRGQGGGRRAGDGGNDLRACKRWQERPAGAPARRERPAGSAGHGGSAGRRRAATSGRGMSHEISSGSDAGGRLRDPLSHRGGVGGALPGQHAGGRRRRGRQRRLERQERSARGAARRGSGGETLTGAGGTRTEGSHWSAGPTYVVSPVAEFCTSPAARSVPAIGRIRTVKPPGTLAGIG
jgi:hypothetical protein